MFFAAPVGFGVLGLGFGVKGLGCIGIWGLRQGLLRKLPLYGKPGIHA